MAIFVKFANIGMGNILKMNLRAYVSKEQLFIRISYL